MKATAIIVAAGEGRRMAQELPKPYIKLKVRMGIGLADVPIIGVSLKVFESAPEIKDIIVVTQPMWIEYCRREVVEKFGFKKVSSIIKGGPHRQDSVLAGLKVAEWNIVLIHDAVRPFITREFISKLIKLCNKYGAVVPALPSTDTIKEVERGWVFSTLKRERLYEVQTPQVFKYDIIKSAYAEAYSCGFYGTDDASLVERIGARVKVAAGLPSNIKITTPEDLALAQYLLNVRRIRMDKM